MFAVNTSYIRLDFFYRISILFHKFEQKTWFLKKYIYRIYSLCETYRLSITFTLIRSLFYFASATVEVELCRKHERWYQRNNRLEQRDQRCLVENKSAFYAIVPWAEYRLRESAIRIYLRRFVVMIDYCTDTGGFFFFV